MKRNIHYLSMVAAILFLLIIVVEPADSRRRFGENSSGTIYLVGGRQKVLKIKGIQKVAIGNPSVADVKPLGTNQVLVTGVGVGKTTLIIWKKSGEQESFYIKVSARDPKSLQAEISKMLGDREGISIRLVGEMVVMDGHALTTEDYLRFLLSNSAPMPNG